MKYRPWGPIDWALSLSEKQDWHFVGTLGTEERSLCCWQYIKNSGFMRSEQLVQIQDADSDKYRERTEKAIKSRWDDFVKCGGSISSVETLDLMSELFILNRFAEKAESNGTSVVLDITSFPKRFFFPVLRKLVDNPRIENLLLAYTSPERYASDGDPLYEDIEPWRELPGFGSTSRKVETWVVSVGFLVESLSRYAKDNPSEEMKLLIPFPAPLAVLRKTWEAVANLEGEYPAGKFKKFRVETFDMSAAFDRICSLAGNPAKQLAFAPFGPKPTSAAMCLYAIQKDASVHYPQPTVYHPDYSQGIRNNDPSTAINAYWVKYNGENLYKVEN